MGPCAVWVGACPATRWLRVCDGSPGATEAQAPELKVLVGSVGLGAHLLRAVLFAVDHCAAELAAGLRRRSAMEAPRGHRAAQKRAAARALHALHQSVEGVYIERLNAAKKYSF